jgi:hypothetical protein
MSSLHFFQWLTHTPFSVYIRHSTWDFAVIEMFHLLGLAVLGGTILLIDLRLLGVGLRRQPVSRVASELLPVLLVSLAVMVISGALMVTAAPLKYYFNEWFRLKMICLAIAVAFYFTLHLKVVRSNEGLSASLLSKVAAVISLILWLGVGLAGRAIGFL